jgi:HEAT repeat protein
VTIHQAIIDALICVSAVLAVLAVATAIRKSIRDAADRRRERIEAEVRPRLLKLLATEGEQEGDLATVGGREGRVLESVTASLLTKLRGEDRAAVVQMLEARGLVQSAQRALRGRGIVKRARAAELLGATAVPAAYEDLTAALQDRNEELRGVAARALGRMGLAEAVAPLLDSLDSEHPVPAGVVTMSLLHIGPPAEEPLRELGLTHESPTARRIAAELLGVQGAFAAVGALTEMARNDEDPDVRTAAVAALGRIGHPGGIDTLVDCFAGEQPAPLRAAAARSLGQVGSPKALEALVAAVGHEEHIVARNAADALTRLGGPGRAALYDIARQGDTASQYARGALSAADARAVRSGRAA